MLLKLQLNVFSGNCTRLRLHPNKQNIRKNPNFREADQLAICKYDRGVEQGSTEKEIQFTGQSET